MRLRFSIFGNAYYFTFKFLGLTALFVAIFCSLGAWQVKRAEGKAVLVKAYAERPKQTPLRLQQLLHQQEDSRYYRISLSGHFDQAHELLLDNKTHEGRVGYEVYTPFLSEGQAILIDRGWIPADRDRRKLPSFKTPSGTLSLEGVVATPPAYFSLGSLLEGPEKHFPLRIQYVNPEELGKILPYSLLAYVVWLDPKSPYGFEREWKVTLMSPEKHIMYAVQWFAFALSLLVLFVVLNVHRNEE